MSLVVDDGTGDFCFVWTIQNFSHCLQKTGEALASPPFKYGGNSSLTWCLVVYPRGSTQADYVAVYLKCISSRRETQFDFAIAALSDNGLFRKVKDSKANLPKTDWKEGFSNFISINELSKLDGDTYLVADSLTFRCRIWNCSPACGRINARTVIGIEKIFQKITLSNVMCGGKTKKVSESIKPSSDETQLSTIDFSWSRGHFLDLKILIDINPSQTHKTNYMTCDISVLDADDKILHSIRDGHLFQVSSETQTWSLPSLMASKFKDLSDLNLDCVFVISTGVSHNQVEYTNFGKIINSPDKCRSKKPKDSEDIGSLGGCLRRYYLEGKSSDVTVRSAGGRDHPAHKTVLCARSRVFEAMFEHDTTERRTGVVEIEDLEDETVSRLLLYVYTDVVGDLDWETSCNLYFAADKYGLSGLKGECSDFLESGLSCENVCRVLVLAVMHHDDHLKTAVKDFIQKNSAEIMNSEQWKVLMKDNSCLAAEIMHLIITENVKKF